MAIGAIIGEREAQSWREVIVCARSALDPVETEVSQVTERGIRAEKAGVVVDDIHLALVVGSRRARCAQVQRAAASYVVRVAVYRVDAIEPLCAHLAGKPRNRATRHPAVQG